MKKIRKIMIFTFILCISIQFAAFGEGMGAIKFNDHEQVLIYTNNDGTCITNQWKQMWDNWYYFGEDGKSKQNTWAEIEGNWYYFDSFSIMLHDTTTPDGYKVGSNGAWVQ